MLASVYRGLIDLLAPALCSACDKPVDARESALCLACEACLERAAPGDEPRTRAVYAYGGAIADALWRLKYEGRSEIARAFRAALCAEASLFGALDAVVPVPLAPAKLRARGYNQSALLASQVARGLGVSFQPRWLVRTRVGARQVGSKRDVRLLQLADLFRANAAVRAKTVLVVDDVRTTGATLREAVRALEAAGAARAWGLVLAQADGPR